METHPLSNYPLPTHSSLQLQYVGKSLTDVPTPAAVLDASIVRRNCDAMLGVCGELGVEFRAHVKSHKTTQLSKLQVGDTGPVNFITSTLIEAENLLPLVLEYQREGRPCSILYGVPIPQSALPRLLHLATKLPPYTLSILIDNLSAFTAFFVSLPPTAKIGVYIKIDSGYHRAGIKTTSPQFPNLIQAVVEKTREGFQGFYSHFGHSYAGANEDDAARGLIEELSVLEQATRAIPPWFMGRPILTVGATPTSTAAQNMLSSTSPRVGEFRALLGRLKKKFRVELHAGVYPLLDLQQVATHARPAQGEARVGFEPLNKESIGMKMLVEVTSVYDEREKPEALVSAGSLALGREPCKSYPGWGIVSGDLGNRGQLVYDERGDRTGWIVGRISQEHGILSWEGPEEKMQPLNIGDKLLIWPNHACVAGAGMGWYLIVDSDLPGGGDRIVDVWVRWRGW